MGIGYSYPHILRLFSGWTYFDFFVANFLALTVSLAPSEIAKSIIFPASAIFIGFTISWGANAQTLIMSVEIGKLSRHNQDGMENYIFPFHLAIFAFMIAVSMWGLAAIGVFDSKSNDNFGFLLKSVGISFCVFFTCMAIRVCWSVTVMIGVFMFTVTEIRKIKKFKIVIRKPLLRRKRL